MMCTSGNTHTEAVCSDRLLLSTEGSSLLSSSALLFNQEAFEFLHKLTGRHHTFLSELSLVKVGKPLPQRRLHCRKPPCSTKTLKNRHDAMLPFRQVRLPAALLAISSISPDSRAQPGFNIQIMNKAQALCNAIY